jgi:TetR/AcrR family transcriptional regulator
MVEQSKPRRSPTGDERKRDPERSRERILDAALVEFGEHGFAGARIGAIARRAGVNQQLISYYFDGKEGLYRALNERWRSTSAQLNRPDAPMGEVVAGFAEAATGERHWARLLVWEGLSAHHEPEKQADGSSGPDGNTVDGNTADSKTDSEADTKRFHEAMVADLRRRQENGEIAADLDPAYLMLLLFGATLAPVVLPQFAENFTGLAAGSPEFQAAFREQLKRLMAHLAA